jgi:hypothetical protein
MTDVKVFIVLLLLFMGRGEESGNPFSMEEGDRISKARQIQARVAKIRGRSYKDPLEILIEDHTAVPERDRSGRKGAVLKTRCPLPAGALEVPHLEGERPWMAPGYYERKTGQVRIRDESLFYFHVGAVHGFVYALQDQYHPLEDLWKGVDENGDRQRALAAMIQGEAQLVLSLYTRQYASELADGASSWKSMTHAMTEKGFPSYLVGTLTFPYTRGESFVKEVYQRRGWRGVDRLFEDPPRSTEQIMHPMKYLTQTDPPRSLKLANLIAALPAGWEKIHEDTMGELGLSLMVAELSDAIRALRSTTGWGGDRFAVYKHEKTKERALYMLSLWDHADDAWQFFDAVGNGLASQLKTTQTIRETEVDLVFMTGEERSILLELREQSVLILQGFFSLRNELRGLSEKAWDFSVSK